MQSDSTFIMTLWRTFSRGRRTKHTWRSFIDTFVQDPEVVRDKRKVAGFSLACFENNRRTLSRVEQVHALVLDFDNGDTTVKQASKLFPETASVIYTTFSHSPKCPKLRIILPFEKSLSAEEYARVWDWASRRIIKAGHALDESTRDASRFWFLPSHQPGAPYEWKELNGKPFDVATALKEVTSLTRPLPGPSTAEKAGAPLHPRGNGRVSVIDDTVADQTFFGRAFVLADMAFDVLDNDMLPVICPWAKTHTTGEDGDSSTVIMPPTTDAGLGLFHCSHAHCVRRTTLDLLDALPVAALEAARKEHGRGFVRARIIDGWVQRLESLPDAPPLDRFILKLRPREGAVFTMTAKLGSSMHLKYLDALALPMLIGRRVDLWMERKEIKTARLVSVPQLEITKAKQRAQVTQILERHAPGDSVSGVDFDVLFAMVCLHPRFEEKIGGGVRRIRVRETDTDKCFELVRVDGSCVDF